MRFFRVAMLAALASFVSAAVVKDPKIGPNIGPIVQEGDAHKLMTAAVRRIKQSIGNELPHSKVEADLRKQIDAVLRKALPADLEDDSTMHGFTSNLNTGEDGFMPYLPGADIPSARQLDTTDEPETTDGPAGPTTTEPDTTGAPGTPPTGPGVVPRPGGAGPNRPGPNAPGAGAGGPGAGPGTGAGGPGAGGANSGTSPGANPDTTTGPATGATGTEETETSAPPAPGAGQGPGTPPGSGAGQGTGTSGSGTEGTQEPAPSAAPSPDATTPGGVSPGGVTGTPPIGDTGTEPTEDVPTDDPTEDEPITSIPGAPGVPGTDDDDEVDPSPEDTDEGVCFPADATVELDNGAMKRMAELELGDKVRVGANSFSEVFMFTHRLATVKHAFLRIVTGTGRELSLTKSHYMYVNGGLSAAENVKTGDDIILANGSVDTVADVKEIMSQGLYNPQTIQGDIVVNGVLASTYTKTVNPSTAHAFLAPLRAVYEHIGYSMSALEAGAGFIANLVPSGPLSM